MSTTIALAPAPKPAAGIAERLLALGEVVAVLAVAHLAVKAFHHYTALGRWERAQHLNFAVGWTLIVAAYAAVCLRKRNLAAYGLAIGEWPAELARTIRSLATRTRVPGWAWCSFAIVYLATCVVLGLRHMSAPQLAWLMAWQLFATALGEEVFFRGYMHARLNEVFPRRFRLRGVAFGFGLIATAVLFGALHAFNTVNIFDGRYTFAWVLALSTMLAGLLYGFLREATGSIVPGILLHALNNLFWFTAMPAVTRLWLKS